MGRGTGVAVLVALVLPLTTFGPRGCSPADDGTDESVSRAYEFLDSVIDQGASGPTPRLPRSYLGGTLERDGYTSSTTYDDALVIDALLARGNAGDVERATAVAAGLRQAQARDPAGDGRLRASYASGPVPADGPVPATNNTTDTGALAWAGRSLLYLHQRDHQQSTLDSSLALAGWLEAHTRDDRGAGGYTGGLDAQGQPLRWKSTEQNLDLVAFFGALARSTGDPLWARSAAHARSFVESMYDGAGPRFWTGTGLDGVTVNRDFIPSDTQTWSYLALADPRFAGTLDYAATAFSVQDGQFRGISVTAAVRSGVWFEGTAHLAAALRRRAGPGDADRARELLAALTLAQTQAPNADGRGIVAASRDTPPNQPGPRLYASRHTGTTAWYVMARLGFNPLAPE